jgi:hypothetical protein
MIYQRPDGKVLVTAAGKLYNAACPPPPNCCDDDDGWGGDPPWGSGNTPPDWFDPSRPPQPPRAANCPEGACSSQEGASLCSQLAIGGPGCAFCCCPTRECDEDDATECLLDMDVRYTIRYKATITTTAGSYGVEITIISNGRYHQNPLAGTPGQNCCKISGTWTETRRDFDTRSGYDVTTTTTSTPDDFGCPVRYRSVAGPSPTSCLGRQPPPPDPGGCGGLCDVDILTAFRTCRQATFRRYQKITGTDSGGPFTNESEQVYFAVWKPTNGSTACPQEFLSSDPGCAAVGGDSGYLP